MSNLSSTPHSVLHYLISRAILEGKVGKTELKIPLIELLKDFGDKYKDKDVSGVLLKIEFETSWDEGDDEDLTVIMDDDEEINNGTS